MKATLTTVLVAAALLVISCGSEPAGAPEASFGEVSSDLGDLHGDAAADLPDALPDAEIDLGPVLCTPGEPCDDGNPCTLNDACKAGICSGDLFSCDDGLPCTKNVCLPDGACDHPLKPDWCFIDDNCYQDGDPNPDKPCESCVTPTATDAWTPDDTRDCDDDDPCTTDDRCEDGVCLGTPLLCPQGDSPCTTSVCLDGDCQAIPQDGDPCDDGDPCTADDYCQDGDCNPGTALDCNDDNPCTDDSCVPGAGCLNAPNSVPCDDANPCTIGDACGSGSCVPGTGQPDCDDANPCTDDSCHPVDGCMHFPNAGLCDDGDPCFSPDFCAGGTCQQGPLPALCDDANACTDDSCVLSAGCLFTPNAASCDDGDACFSDDLCAAGACVPGPTPLDCDDANACTADACTPFLGCSSTPALGPCDDANPCTDNDQCDANANCAGELISCEDPNPCTLDSCDPAAGCVHAVLKTTACRPKIVISYPPRGATINGDPVVSVTGTVTSLGGAITTFTINGDPVAVNPDGSFLYPMPAAQGLNLIIAEATDELGNARRTSPSYYFSFTWYPMDIANPKAGQAKDGLLVFLGPEVWDDNNTADVDDVATVMTLYIQALDLGAIVTNPVTTGSFGWCSYKMNVKNITHAAPAVDLVPIDGGLYMFVSIPSFKADIEIDNSGFLCFDMSGTATASAITIAADVLITMDANGNVVATLQDPQVAVNDLNINISGIWGFLLNWLINFFEDSFAQKIAESFKSQLGGVIPNAIVQALNSLAFNNTFTVQPIFGAGMPATLTMASKLSSVKFEAAGATLGMWAGITTPKVIAHSPLGSIGRAACLAPQPEVVAMPQKGQLEVGIYDDFLNQVPFGMYWAGLFQGPVDPATLGGNLEPFGITDMSMNVDFLLPPVVTSCTPDLALVLQIGDMRVDMDFLLMGMPVKMTMYASVEVNAQFVAADAAGGKQLSIAVGDVRFAEVEITEVTGALEGAEDIVVALVKDQLIGKLLTSFAGGTFGSIPIPDVDLAGMHPSVPPGSKISLDLKEIIRLLGYTILSGDVKQ